ncbi:kinase-like domain-containing protein [Gorgonomyces haynaldii]|nr:kinase-like domain-containing protein [Gorgonomyces haynaldii]
MGLFSNLFKKRDKESSFNEFDTYFFLGRQLGSGAFAVVHEATRKSDSKHFAVKIITKSKVKDQFEVVSNEIDILRQVKHKHIISLEDMYETKDKYYLVMDMATGGELFDRILAKGSYTEADAARIIKQLLEAVEYLHDEVDIVHRDLKPENLLFRDKADDADILVTDFGLSKTLKDSDFTSTTCGSPHYVAPEILKNTGHGKPVDMWAIGVIAYVLLCGYTPFWGGENNSTQYLYQCIVTGKYKFDPEWWSLVSDEAKGFIQKLLIVNPSKRMTAKEALKDPWLQTQAKVDLLPSFSSNFNAKRTFKKVALAVAGMQRLRVNSKEDLTKEDQ